MEHSGRASAVECLQGSVANLFCWNYTFKDSLWSLWNAYKRSNQLHNNLGISCLEGTLVHFYFVSEGHEAHNEFSAGTGTQDIQWYISHSDMGGPGNQTLPLFST